MRLLCLLLSLTSVSIGATVDEAVDAVLGIEAAVAGRLKRELRNAVGDDFDFGEHSETITDFLARGVINEASETMVAASARALLDALREGAPKYLASDIAEIGFTERITGEQIVSSCIAKATGQRFGLNPAIVDELIYDGIVQGRPGNAIEATVLGVEKGVRAGIPQAKMAIALMVRFAQETEDKRMADIIAEEIAFVQKHRTPEEIENERLAASLVQEGVDGQIVREIQAIALERQWDHAELRAALYGLRAAYKRNLTLEKVATALVIRIAQGYSGQAEKMVQEELEYVARLAPEKKKLETLEKDPVLKQFVAGAKQRIKDAIAQGATTDAADYFARPGVGAPGKKIQEKKNRASDAQRKKIAKVDGERETTPQRMEKRIFDQSIQSFLTARAPRNPASTPYKWGGATRKGVDCSGFTMVCYKEQGVVIPRVSRVQYATYKQKGNAVAKKNLQYGDLVFFSSNGHGRITHVGMFYKKNDKGENMFVHSSCTPGVNICNLDKNRYWAPRYVGAVRVIDNGAIAHAGK